MGKDISPIESLPLMAQVAPGFGSVLGDFNGDGYTDAYIVQNSYAPRREIGRMDGGLSVLLEGRQDGTFDTLSPAESGLIVPGDAKSLVAIDINEDRWPDFVVGINNEAAVAFENRPVDNYEIATVTLHGPPGNPNAVGARVTLHRSDGWNQTAEVQAGSGYLSQQPATLVFGFGGQGPGNRVPRSPLARRQLHPPSPYGGRAQFRNETRHQCEKGRPLDVRASVFLSEKSVVFAQSAPASLVPWVKARFSCFCAQSLELSAQLW